MRALLRFSPNPVPFSVSVELLKLSDESATFSSCIINFFSEKELVSPILTQFLCNFDAISSVGDVAEAICGEL